MTRFTLALTVLAAALFGANAACPNSCSGHGKCNMYDECECYTSGGMFGHLDETLQWTGPDCSLKTCPRGTSHTRTPMYKHATDAQKVLHAANAVCSDRGTCDHSTGECQCLEGWTGSACQYTACKDLSNGVCTSNEEFARLAVARRTATGSLWPTGVMRAVAYSGAWDTGLQYGALCDIGFRGAGCQEVECPSFKDPLNPDSGAAAGLECSGRGLCNYESGLCECFPDFTGNGCQYITTTV